MARTDTPDSADAKPDLTKRQQQIYNFVKGQITGRGYGPTVREIGTEFGIKSPNGVMCHLKALEKKGFITRDPNMSRAITLAEPLNYAKTALPLAGSVAAGSPVLGVEETESVDFADLFEDEDLFCLKVRGESMIEDHICPGDFVIVRRQETAEDGDIVVALVEGSETTLKRFFKERGRYRLQPANEAMEPIWVDEVEIQGVVQSVIRASVR